MTMPDFIPPEFTPETFAQVVSTAFADLIKEGGFELVESLLQQSAIFVTVVYSSPTCLLKFTLDAHMGSEWDLKMARQPKEDQFPEWTDFEGVCQFLRNESSEETYKSWVSFNDTYASQIPLRDYAEYLKPFNLQVVKFFDCKDFEERWENYKSYNKWHSKAVVELLVERNWGKPPKKARVKSAVRNQPKSTPAPNVGQKGN